MRLSYTTDQTGAEVNVRLAGEIDAAMADDLRRVLQAETDRAGIDLVNVDLDLVTLLESPAIGALVAASKSAAKVGRRLHISRANGMVRRALTVTGVLDALGAPG